MTTINNGSTAASTRHYGLANRFPILQLRRTALAAAIFVTGIAALGAATQPAQAQAYPSVDCNNPYYYQYCQDYDAWNNQYYSPYGYGGAYPYYGYGFHGGGFHGGGFHGGGFRGGDFRGGGFHGGGSRGGGFHGGGHGGGGHR
jgi:hypothetical protein